MILQTFGQSTERLEDKKSTKITEDLIINTYWREHLVSYTRRDQLLELTLKLRKIDLDQFFQYPVQKVLTEDEWVYYKEIISHPLCMEDIVDRIHNDKYDEKLDDFARDVRTIYK